MPDPVSWTLLASGGFELAKIIMGGVVAATVTLVVSGRRQKQDRERAASALAIRLVDHFERYAMACANVPAKNARNERRDPFDYSGVWGVPPFPELPSNEEGWRSLDLSLATESLTFGTRVEVAIDMCRAVSDYGDGDGDDYEAEADKQALTVGLLAWRLAGRLRNRFKLPKAEPEWDIEADMSGQLERALKSEQTRNAANAAMFAELSTTKVPPIAATE